ncbi:Protein kinase-like domain containing protein [Naviculisporaceae sp. PSN 640]
MMAPTRPLSDLVRDKKIETEVSNNSTKHVFYTPGRSAQKRQRRDVETWVRNACLGQGAFGTVYREKCEEGKRQNEFRAVKEIKKRFAAGEELDYTRELEAIIKFSNPKYSHCFVHCDGWFETTESVFISMEYVKLGDLQNYLTQPLYESDARAIISQVLEGLQIMHENDFVHRDLKPGNIMVITKRPWFVKIADFGISKRRMEDVTALRTLQRGTFGFAAPEIFGFGADSDDGSYTPAVDMWSVGAVTYKILTGLSPFPDLAMEIMYATGKSEFPLSNLEAKRISPKGQDFILRLMARTPKDRLTAAGARDHDWMRENVDEFSGEHLSTIDPSQQLSSGDTFNSEGSGLWTFDDTATKFPITREKPKSPKPGLAYKAPYLEEGETNLDQSPNNPLPRDSPVLLREATITADNKSKPAAPPAAEVSTKQDDKTPVGDRSPSPPRRPSIDSSSSEPNTFTDSSSPHSPRPAFIDNSGNSASTSDPDPPMDSQSVYSDLIREAMNECSATFQVDRFIDSVENPYREPKAENYYATASLPLKTLLRSQPGILISHNHVIKDAIYEISDPDVRAMLRKVIDDIISQQDTWSAPKAKSTTLGCREGHHDPTVARPGTRCCHCDACEETPRSSSTNCFECGQLANTDATVRLECLHRICHPCLKRKFWLSLEMPISRNMPPRCCTEDPIPTEHVKDLLDEGFWEQWEAELLDANARVVRVWCPRCKSAIIAFDRTCGREPKCSRCLVTICPLCDRPSHPERSCGEGARITEPVPGTSEERLRERARPSVHINEASRERSRERTRLNADVLGPSGVFSSENNRSPGRSRQNPDSGRGYFIPGYPDYAPAPDTARPITARPMSARPNTSATRARENRRSQTPYVEDFPEDVQHSTHSYRPADNKQYRVRRGRQYGPEDVQYSPYPYSYREDSDDDRTRAVYA